MVIMTTPPPTGTGRLTYENFVKSFPHPPRLPVKCKRTGTTSLTSYQRSRSNIHSNGGKSHSGAMHAIRATIHRKTSYRLTGGLKFDGWITGWGSGGLRKFRNPLHKSAGYYTKSVVSLPEQKKPQCDNTTVGYKVARNALSTNEIQRGFQGRL